MAFHGVAAAGKLTELMTPPEARMADVSRAPPISTTKTRLFIFQIQSRSQRCRQAFVNQIYAPRFRIRAASFTERRSSGVDDPERQPPSDYASDDPDADPLITVRRNFCEISKSSIRHAEVGLWNLDVIRVHGQKF